MAFDREKMKARLQGRTKEIYDQGSGSSFKNIFIPTLPEGISLWKPKAGNHSIDPIPYFAGEHDPDCQAGEVTYVLALWVHFNVGPDNDSYICMSKTYNKPCAICDFIREAQKSMPKVELDKMKAKERAIYYVIVYDSPEEERKGLQIWNAPHFKMQRFLNELSKIPERQGVKVGGHISFTDPDEGKTVCFKIVGEKESTDYIAHRFIDRDYKIPDDILAKASQHPLDMLLSIPNYQAVENVVGLTALRAREQAGSVSPVGPSTDLAQASLPLPVMEEEQTGSETPEGEFVCPGGGLFGEDTEQLPACSDCEGYDACKAAFDKARAERAAKRSGLKRQAA